MFDSKEQIRKHCLNLLRNQKEEDRSQKNLRIRERLFALPEFRRSQIILFYASFDGEVETWEMMKLAQQQGKQAALPIIHPEEKKIIPTLVNNLDSDLKAGPYGISQPYYDQKNILDISELHAILVPGVAFDKQNFRLGRGGGYYDRFLNNLPKDIHTIGLAFDFQVVDYLPHDHHDIPVDQLITNN
jgi:5-formyltetrahydrofolate cyclo-ligase